jgi:hypothetical protein
MNISRRSFLAGFTAAAAAPAAFAKLKSDPDLAVLLSDVHVNGVEGKDMYQRGKFMRVVAEILKMDPLPGHAIFFGDLAWLHGRKEDYVSSSEGIKMLQDAGIHVTLGMGNHDRRSTFLEVHPSYLKTTKIPGRIVSVVDLGRADFIMLDGLQGTDDRGLTEMGPGGGEFDKAQQDWLMDVLPKWKRPVFVGSHWPIREIKVGGKPIAQLFFQSPSVAGYIHGHDHRWYKTISIRGWGDSRQIRGLCLPSTGHWGDIGYATLRLSKDRAVVSLRQYEYYFPSPIATDEKCTDMWRDITAENQNQTCTFRLPTCA